MMAYTYDRALVRRQFPRSRFDLGDFQQELDKLAAKIPSAEDVKATARQLGGNAVNWGKDQISQIKDNAFQYFYLQSRSVLTQFGTNPTAQKIKAAADAAYSSAGTVSTLVTRIGEGKFELDASGIVDVAGVVTGLVDTARKIASAAGYDNKIFGGLMDWGMVGVGCMTMIASTQLVGVAGCAGSIILKIFTGGMQQLAPGFQFTDITHLPREVPRAIYVANVEQVPRIQTDVSRLASVLRYCYGIPRLTDLLAANNLVGHLFAPENYPTAPPSMPDKPIPAFTLVELADMFRGYYFPSWTGANGTTEWIGNTIYRWWETDSALEALMKNREAFDPQAFRGDFRGYPTREYHDYNIAFIENAAAIGRAAVANSGWPLRINRFHGDYANKDYVDLCPLIGYIVVDELINFFVGVTLRELDDTRTSDLQKVELNYLNTGLPVRILAMDPNGKSSYDARCWTKWSRGGVDSCYGGTNDLITAVRNKDPDALKEFASIRLMAAFACLAMQHRWSPRDTPADALAALPTLTLNDPLWLLQTPVDPRQVIRIDMYRWALNETDVSEVVDVAPGDFESICGPRENFIDVQGKIPNGDWITSSFRYVGRRVDSSNGPRIRAIRDGFAIAKLIANREALLGPIKKAAREAAIRDTPGIVQTTGFVTVGGQTIAQRYWEAQKKPVEASRVYFVTTGGKTIGQQVMEAKAKESQLASTLLWTGAAALLALKFLK